MAVVYFNGNFIQKEEVRISPDDRGFLFADGIYEVVRWYGGHFYDMDSHITRLKRSLRELRINWKGADNFASFASELIQLNKLETSSAMVYLQVTRGEAKRTHNFPQPEVSPTVYANSWGFNPDHRIKR